MGSQGWENEVVMYNNKKRKREWSTASAERENRRQYQKAGAIGNNTKGRDKDRKHGK
jgi:hypothetical protein